jgi:hypothetical protein
MHTKFCSDILKGRTISGGTLRYILGRCEAVDWSQRCRVRLLAFENTEMNVKMIVFLDDAPCYLAEIYRRLA